jgi:hypothetical protein
MGYVTDDPKGGGNFGAKKVRDSALSGTDGFKKGGKAEKAKGGCMKKGGVMSSAAKGEKPARATGGGVFSSAKGGTPRGASPKPY